MTYQSRENNSFLYPTPVTLVFLKMYINNVTKSDPVIPLSGIYPKEIVFMCFSHTSLLTESILFYITYKDSETEKGNVQNLQKHIQQLSFFCVCVAKN